MRWYRKPHDNSIDSYLTKPYVDKGKHEYLTDRYIRGRGNELEEEFKAMEQKYKDGCYKAFASTMWHMFLNLIIGVKEVAYYLGESFLDGFGVIKSIPLANLTFSIGAKLGDQKSIGFTSNKTFSNEIEILANKCVAEIRKNEADVRGRDVTWEEIVAIAKAFDRFVYQNSDKLSYYYSIKTDSSEMREYCACVEPIIENNTQYQRPVAPPPPAAYYVPVPPQQPTVYVVKTGGHAPDVHKCEIL